MQIQKKIDIAQNISLAVFKNGTTSLMILPILIKVTDKEEHFLGIANKQSP